MSRRQKQRGANAPLTDPEMRDIKLWFAWGTVYGYITTPRSYLRSMLEPDMRSRFLEQPRALRRAILRFVIDEHARRSIPPCPVPLPTEFRK